MVLLINVGFSIISLFLLLGFLWRVPEYLWLFSVVSFACCRPIILNLYANFAVVSLPADVTSSLYTRFFSLLFFVYVNCLWFMSEHSLSGRSKIHLNIIQIANTNIMVCELMPWSRDDAHLLEPRLNCGKLFIEYSSLIIQYIMLFPQNRSEFNSSRCYNLTLPGLPIRRLKSEIQWKHIFHENPRP